MPKFDVFVPCTVSICVTVDADNKEHAKEIAFDMQWGIKIDRENLDNTADVEIEEFQLHEQVVKGNVFYGVQNELEVCEV